MSGNPDSIFPDLFHSRFYSHTRSKVSRNIYQGLPLAAPELLVVALADHAPPRVVLVRRQVGDLE